MPAQNPCLTFDEWWKTVYRYGSDTYNVLTEKAFRDAWDAATAARQLQCADAIRRVLEALNLSSQDWTRIRDYGSALKSLLSADGALLCLTAVAKLDEPAPQKG